MTIAVRPGELSPHAPVAAPGHPGTGRIRYGSRRRPRPNLQPRSWNRLVPITVRHFVVPETGPLRPIPRRVIEGLYGGTDAIPEFTDSRQRVVEVVLENERGKAVRILDARGVYWQFDEGGRLQRDDEWMRWLFDQPERRAGRVVDLRPEIERAAWKARTRWDVTADDLERIVAAVWPASEAAVAAVQAVTGRAPKRPPLTHEGREALHHLVMKVSEIQVRLESLSEPALKGLAFEARSYGGVYEGEDALWQAIAVAAERQRAIRAQRRMGRGIWYACVRTWRWKGDDRRESHEVDTIEERCEGKAAAVEAARRLLAENAHRFSADVTVEAEVLTELEWTPIKRRREDDDG